MKNLLNSTFYLLFTAIIFSCNNSESKKSTIKVEIDPLVQNIDSSYTPQNDFFMFADNGWFKKHPIKSTERGNGIFKTIDDTVNADVKEICINASKTKAEKGSNTQKIGDYYKSGMDTNTIEKLGISPLKNEFEKIDNITNLDQLTAEIAHLHQIGASPLFSFYINTDDKNSSLNSCFLWQGGLGLGQRDYYFNTDKRNENIRQEYVLHVQKMFQLLNEDEKTAVEKSKTIMKIETDLAKVSKKLEDLRDPYKNYNKIAFTDLNIKFKNINWQTFFKTVNLNNVDSVVVGQPKFYTALGNILKNTASKIGKLTANGI